MKKILITGANGLLGQTLVRRLHERFDVLATGVEPKFVLDSNKYRYEILDITEAAQCKSFINSFTPDVVINAASMTNVDECEKKKELCWKINVKGVENLAKASKQNMALLVHLSTDYIFDGKSGPYSEEDPANPLGYYGKSKLASENFCRITGIPHAIVRTSVLFGLGEQVKANFFLWLYSKLKKGEPVTIVTDQYNTPTFVEDLANGIELLVEKSAYGIFNISGPEFLNRFEFATTLAETFGFPQNLIKPILTKELNQPAKRPVYGGLKISKAENDLGYHPKSLREAFQILEKQLQRKSDIYG